MNQSITDKIKIEGWGGDGPHKVMLSATCHPNEVVLAKEILWTLYNAYPCFWDVEFQNDTINFWSGLHSTFGCRVRYKDLNKGLSIFRRKGKELIERIHCGAV